MIVEWVDNDALLADVLRQHAGAEAVAIDTEFRRRDTYFPQVALLQLCWNDVAYLIDPSKLSNTDLLRNLLQSPAVVKFLHSASEDLEVFDHWLGVLPQPLFDTQRAAGLLGHDSGLSYRALVMALLDIEVPKDETQSDWLQRPLTSAQQRYAAMDVFYLREVGQRLMAQARDAGRLDWVSEDGDRMAPGGRGPLAKFKSAWKLDDRQRAVLVQLVEWRELRAQERDKPRNWIADDKALMNLAIRQPASMTELDAIDGLPPSLVRRQGRALLAAIVLGIEAADEITWRPAVPLSRELKAKARMLADERDTLAAALQTAPDILLNNRELELLIREAAGQTIEIPGHWSGWRSQTAVAPLREAAARLFA